MPGHHDHRGIRLLAQREVGAPPTLGDGFVDEHVLAESEGLAIANIDAEPLGAEHAQRDVLCYRLIQGIEHAGGRTVLPDVDRVVDQVGPHGLLNSCGLAREG